MVQPGGAAPTPPALLDAGPIVPVIVVPDSAPSGVPATTPVGDLWQRIRLGYKMPDLETRLVDERTRWYAGQPEYFARMTQRSSRYLFHIVEEIERRGMPTELALLPFVESAFVPEANSSASAAGLWQFIPSTGRSYALEQNMWKDERRDVVESTRAALDYLQKLHDMFGDWHLALASYNWGEGAVSRAIAKNRRAGKPGRYTDLQMPNETQHYVPKLQAVKNIVSNPEKYGVTLPPIDNAPHFIAVHKTRDIDVHTAAKLAEMKVEDFRALNPAFNRPVILGAGGGAQLLLPADKVERFQANVAAWEATGQPLASWTTYKTIASDTLAAVAKRAGISEDQLREANRIPPRHRLGPGSTILVPRDETMETDIPAESLTGRFALMPEQSNVQKITYRVRRGDTVASVARRWNVLPKDLIVWNRLTAPALFAGQRLELTVPAAQARSRARKSAVPVRKPTAARSSVRTPARSRLH
ncbi:MAG: transglycosylase SLT domain-containing protein [Pseudomonadota bacterium]|nr:transglycosylase SLT domain-containing protein [Pseudomonadota bacterium]